MGCGESKLDELPAVALCRDRSRLVADAILRRHALAEAHAAYAGSLRSVGDALQSFLLKSGPSPDSPLLSLPTHAKSDPTTHRRHHDHHHPSEPHIQCEPNSDPESDDGISPFHSSNASPVQIHYAKRRPTAPSVTYQQVPRSPEVVHYGEAAEPYPSSSSSAYGYSNYHGYAAYADPIQNSSFYPYSYPPDYPYYAGYAYPPAAPQASGGASSSSSKAPPPPPSPPTASTWDFLNPFGGYENYYAHYSTPSRSSREVREEEGIPDLEDDDSLNHKYNASSSGAASGAGNSRRSSAASGGTKEDDVCSAGESPHYKTRSSSSPGEIEVHEVEKNVVDVGPQQHRQHRRRHRPEVRRNVAAASTALGQYRDVSEVVQKIMAQFDRASESAEVVFEMLEVGNVPNSGRNSLYSVSSSKLGEDQGLGTKNVSSTLNKLYIWEKKLHQEVRAEEKMRILHDRYCKRLAHLEKMGAEDQKIEATRASIRKLRTRMRIAIEVIDSISKRITKLRDEELWPHINEVIWGFTRMWRIMLECHQAQFHAISEAKSLEVIMSSGKLSATHLEVTKQLELEMLDWVGNFCTWINAQKGYVKSVNAWLSKWLHYEPGVAASSPGSLGAPPVFVICNYWSQAIDKISEREVVDSMQTFAAKVMDLWEEYRSEQRDRMIADSYVNEELKYLESEEHKMQKAFKTKNKKMALVSQYNNLLYMHQGKASEASSLQVSLEQVFEAMEYFTATSMKAYEELHIRSQELRLGSENSKVP